jgi:hypothetical protein
LVGNTVEEDYCVPLKAEVIEHNHAIIHINVWPEDDADEFEAKKNIDANQAYWEKVNAEPESE